MASEALEQRFADLQARLAALQDATSQLRELIQRLASFDFQPGSIPLDAGDDENVGAELSSEINQALREQEEELELLQEEIVDIRPGKRGKDELRHHDKERLKDGAERLKKELQSCRVAFRKAQLSARQKLQLAQKQERELLYASFAAPRSASRSGASSPAPSLAPRPQRRRRQTSSEMTKDEQAISASHDVTQALRRTHDLMAAELTKSDFANKTLLESQQAMKQLAESYSSLDTMLSSSRDLLGTLLKSQKSDTWYLETSFALLVGTIGWLVFRRFLYGPMWWLIWIPLKLLFRGAVGVSNAVGLRGDGAKDVAGQASGVQPGSPSISMDSDGVPTMRVGQEEGQQGEEPEDPDSMAEKVGRIIDESKDNGFQEEKGETVLRERREDEPPNPKKRVLEGDDASEQKSERAKDEL